MGRNSTIGSLGTSSQGTDLVPIAPSDTEDLLVTARAIRCRPDGTGGTIRLVTYSGQLRNTYIAAGETLLVLASRVHATGTAATGLEAYI